MTSVENLVKSIKKKRELSGISDKLVSELLESYLKRNSLNLEKISPPSEKIIIKDIRAELRKYVGRFQVSKKISLKKRFELLEKNKIKELLKTHSSTKERIDSYLKIKRLIKKLAIKK